MYHPDQGYSGLVFKDDQDSRFLKPAKLNRLNKTHLQGAFVRSGASIFIWLLTFIAYRYGIISKVSFEGASIINGLHHLDEYPPACDTEPHQDERSLYEYFSFLINVLEIFGYTGFIYFAGGFQVHLSDPDLCSNDLLCRGTGPHAVSVLSWQVSARYLSYLWLPWSILDISLIRA